MSSTGLRYRTPADVRAIPNDQWEQWVRGNDLPFRAFAAVPDTQTTLRHVLKATLRRMESQ